MVKFVFLVNQSNLMEVVSRILILNMVEFLYIDLYKPRDRNLRIAEPTRLRLFKQLLQNFMRVIFWLRHPVAILWLPINDIHDMIYIGETLTENLLLETYIVLPGITTPMLVSQKILNELGPIISILCKNNNNTVITRDMNLDLLKIEERE